MGNKVWERGDEIPTGKEKARVFVQVDSTGINDKSIRGLFGAMEVSKDRVEILDKRTNATLQDISTFKEDFVIEAYKYGVFQSKEVLFASDGARWYCQ